MSYKTKLLNNLNLNNKTILIIGGSGEIGIKILQNLIYCNANIILAGRNEDKCNNIINNLRISNNKINIPYLCLDIADLSSIDNALIEINKLNIDYIMINSGIYNPKLIYNDKNIEMSFLANFYGPYYLIKKLNNRIKIVVTGSISYKYVNIDYNDLFNNKYKKSSKIYSYSKRLLLEMCILLKYKYNYNIEIAHPGISYTKLFKSLHNKGISKLLLPLYKLIFMSNDKASLNMIYALEQNTKYDKWIGPSYISEVFGRPRINKLKRKILNISNLELLENKIKEFEEEYI